MLNECFLEDGISNWEEILDRFFQWGFVHIKPPGGQMFAVQNDASHHLISDSFPSHERRSGGSSAEFSPVAGWTLLVKLVPAAHVFMYRDVYGDEI